MFTHDPNKTYPIPMTDWAKNYNAPTGYLVRLVTKKPGTSWDTSTKTELFFKTLQEAFDKFLEIQKKYQSHTEDFPGSDDGEYWFSWMPNHDRKDKSIDDAELYLAGLYDPRVDEYRLNRCWIPPVISTFHQMIAEIRGDHPLTIWDEEDPEDC